MDDLKQTLTEALSGRYDIGHELGAGGMAHVFQALDVKHQRDVAVKILRPEIAGSVGAERFAAEIMSVAQLNHPHILGLIDSGEAGGLFYYVMPYVEGESLEDRIEREGPLPQGEAVRLAVEIAQGLAYAHKRGFVHRDIKPANILLSDGHALIADFGIARAIDQGTEKGLTQTGTAIGTPTYMSPEQFNGDGVIDGRGDLYSLGCLTFEMLTGAPPFDGTSFFSLMASHASGEIPSMRDTRPDVSPLVESAVARALAKTPEARFDTTTDFAAALTGEHDLLTTGVTPTGVSGRGRWRWLRGGLGAVALAGIVTVALTRESAPPPENEPTPAVIAAPDLVASRVVVAPLENASGRADLDAIGDMGSDWITQGLHETGIVDVVPSPTARQAARAVAAGMAGGANEDPVRLLAEETRAAIVISGRYYALGDSLYFQLDITDAGTDQLLDALGPIGGSSGSPLDAVQSLRGQVMGSLAINLDPRLEDRGAGTIPPSFDSYRAFNRGLDAYIESDWATALDGLHEAYELDASFPVPLLYAVLSHSNMGQFDAADSVLTVLSAAEADLSDYHRHWVDHITAMFLGDRNGGYEAIRRASDLSPGSKASYNAAWAAVVTRRAEAALELLNRLEPQRGPMRGWIHWGLMHGEALHVLGRYEEELEGARDLQEQFPFSSDPLRVQGLALAALGRLDEAQAIVDQALTLEPSGNSNPGFAALGIAQEMAWQGYDDEARSVVEQAVAWYESRPESERNQMGMAQEYADGLLRLDRFDEAAAVWADLNERFPGRWAFELAYGVIAAKRGDRELALEADARLAEVEDRWARGSDTQMRAVIAAHLGEAERAISLLARSYDEGVFYSRHPQHHFLSLRGNPDFEEVQGLLRSN